MIQSDLFGMVSENVTLSKVVVGDLQRLGMKRSRLESPGNLQSLVGHEGSHGASGRRGVGDAKFQMEGEIFDERNDMPGSPQGQAFIKWLAIKLDDDEPNIYWLEMVGNNHFHPFLDWWALGFQGEIAYIQILCFGPRLRGGCLLRFSLNAG